MTSNKPRISRCPQCGKSCRTDAENPYRPFCTERCKLMDLGDWLDERHVISEPQQHADEEWSGLSGTDTDSEPDR